MRCSQCNKFAAEDSESSPEVNLDWDGQTASAEVRIVNTCVECSTELKEANLSVEVNFEDEIEAHVTANPKCGKEKSFSVQTLNENRTDRQQTTTKDGRPIKPRYQKRFYGFEMDVELSCDTCSEVVETKSVSDEIQASSMDELS